jgi:hypothetical protein
MLRFAMLNVLKLKVHYVNVIKVSVDRPSVMAPFKVLW